MAGEKAGQEGCNRDMLKIRGRGENSEKDVDLGEQHNKSGPQKK